MNAADPFLVDIIPACEVIPFFQKNPKGGLNQWGGMICFTGVGVLHAGPPIEWKNMCEAMKGIVVFHPHKIQLVNNLVNL